MQAAALAVQGGYVQDFEDYLDRTADRVAHKGFIGLIGRVLTGRVRSFNQFKQQLKSSVSAVWQTTKELTAWATVGITIANEKLGKLLWALLPESFKEPLPRLVREEMDSSLNKVLGELLASATPGAEPVKDDKRCQVRLRRELRSWRERKQTCGCSPSADASAGTGGRAPRLAMRSVPGLAMAPA